MVTQRRSPMTVAASAVVGIALAAVVAGGSYLVSAGGLLGVGPDGLETAVMAREEGAFVEVTDSVGRTVRVPEEPRSIAALDAFSGNVCVLVGAGDRLMGAPGGVLSNKMLQLLCPNLESKDQLSGGAVNAETLLTAGVDVALVRRSLYEADGEVAKLERLGIPYVVVDYDTVEGQQEAIELVGSVCGPDAAQKALEIGEYYRATVELVEERASTIPEEERVRVYHSVNDPLLTDGADSLGADWIARCGAVDVSAGEASTSGQGDYTATLEQVYVWAPDVIVCNTAAAKASIMAAAPWEGLDAVEEGAVYNLPVSTSRWGQRGDPEVFLGMLWLGATLYPQAYADVDLRETVTAYYRDIIGIEVGNELWESIVAGEGLREEGGGQANAS